MAASPGLPDYYAVLQVHPDADDEVIAAAYRQLMKKYHPDLAGEDPGRIAEHAARAKAINEAFSVLRDPDRRRQYDSARIFFGTYNARSAPSPPPRPSPPAPSPRPDEPTSAAPVEVDAPSPQQHPFGLLSALYYLLPGAYEWEQGQTKELVTVALLPVVIIVGFALFTGRLDAWVGKSLVSKAVAAALLLLASVPLFTSLPRVALAAGPSALVSSGMASPALHAAHIPVWLAWLAAAIVSLALSARLYVFSVLPAIAACYLLSALR